MEYTRSEVNSLGALNAELEKIETALDSKVSTEASGPRVMHADLDMNSNDILNLPAPSAPTSPVRLQDIPNLVDQATGANYVGTTPPTAAFKGMRWYDPSVPTTYVYDTTNDVGSWIEEPVQSLDGDLRTDLSAGTADIAGVVSSEVSTGTVKSRELSFTEDPLVPASYSSVIGEQTYAGNLGAGSVLFGMYRGASKNRLLGSPAQLRGIIGGYDNEITSGSTADGLACGIVWSMHSRISNLADHCGISFGSYHEIENGSYSGILSGTTNKILGTYNVNGNDNSVIVGGARTEINGANCVAGGTDNKTRGNGLAVFGILNQVGQTTASDYVFVSGQGNTVNRVYSFTHGLSNVSSRDYTFTVGRSNTTNADYTVAKGRGAIVGIAFSDTFGFDTGSAAGSNQRDRYPLQVTTTNATATNMVTVIQGSVGDVMPDGTVCAASATVIATDGTDTAVFELKACIRRNAGTAVVYNLSNKIGNTAGAATWAATFGGQNDRRITVTGEAGKTIKWTADVTLVTTKL